MPKIHEGLNECGILYYVDGEQRMDCECGYSLPYEPPSAAKYRPNYERMKSHQEDCRAHQIAWALNRRWCSCAGHFVHKDFMRGDYCEFCLEKGT